MGKLLFLKKKISKVRNFFKRYYQSIKMCLNQSKRKNIFLFLCKKETSYIWFSQFIFTKNYYRELYPEIMNSYFFYTNSNANHTYYLTRIDLLHPVLHIIYHWILGLFLCILICFTNGVVSAFWLFLSMEFLKKEREKLYIILGFTYLSFKSEYKSCETHVLGSA